MNQPPVPSSAQAASTTSTWLIPNLSPQVTGAWRKGEHAGPLQPGELQVTSVRRRGRWGRSSRIYRLTNDSLLRIRPPDIVAARHPYQSIQKIVLEIGNDAAGNMEAPVQMWIHFHGGNTPVEHLEMPQADMQAMLFGLDARMPTCPYILFTSDIKAFGDEPDYVLLLLMRLLDGGPNPFVGSCIARLARDDDAAWGHFVQSAIYLVSQSKQSEHVGAFYNLVQYLPIPSRAVAAETFRFLHSYGQAAARRQEEAGQADQGIMSLEHYAAWAMFCLLLLKLDGHLLEQALPPDAALWALRCASTDEVSVQATTILAFENLLVTKRHALALPPRLPVAAAASSSSSASAPIPASASASASPSPSTGEASGGHRFAAVEAEFVRLLQRLQYSSDPVMAFRCGYMLAHRSEAQAAASSSSSSSSSSSVAGQATGPVRLEPCGHESPGLRISQAGGESALWTILNDDEYFHTVRASVRLRRGRWYYEVALSTAGLFQIGFASEASTPNPDPDVGLGVGDDAHSYAYDGFRLLRWGGGEKHKYGRRWHRDDTVGCLLDCDRRRIEFFLNGEPLGPAFEGFDVEEGLAPALSLVKGQMCRLNLGQAPMRYPPPPASPDDPPLRFPYRYYEAGDGAEPMPRSRLLLSSSTTGLPPPPSPSASASASAPASGPVASSDSPSPSPSPVPSPSPSPLSALASAALERPLRASSQGLCSICYLQPANTRLLPCLHEEICTTCAAKLKQCPWCRHDITDRVPASQPPATDATPAIDSASPPAPASTTEPESQPASSTAAAPSGDTTTSAPQSV